MSYSDFPGTTTDEYGRTFCSAHNLARCHICCMDFSDMNDEVDENPSDRDVGVFVSDASLIEWHAKMKIKMPRVFPEDDKVFGNDETQHPYGTKLLAYFDGDKSKPMRYTIIGSRWKDDGTGRYPGLSEMCVDRKEPFYIVYFSDSGDMSQIGLMDCHTGVDEEDGTGWKVVGQESTVSERLDALARAHQNNAQGSHDSEEDETLGILDSDSSVDQEYYDYDGQAYPLPPQNGHIRREGKNMKLWDQATNGPFLDQLYLHSFSASDRGRIMHSNAEGTLAEKVKAYGIGAPPFQSNELNFYARLVLAQIATYYANDHYDGVILQNERKTKFQAIELNNCHAAGQDLAPAIEISYATDPEGIENPRLYFRGDTVKELEVPNQIAVAVESHLLNCVSNEGLNDIGSGLLFHQGYLVPMEIAPWEMGKSSAGNTTTPTIPDIDFGIELEGSCASGNYQTRVATSIAKHSKLEVRVGPGGKGGKGGGTKGGYMCNQKGYSKGSGDGSKSNTEWKLVYDSSVEANVRNPQSLTFEFVSRILCGNIGLDEMSNAIMVLADVACILINESMGLHVHVECKPSDYSLDQMKSICQQFLWYEDVMDSFLPHHRRTGAEKSHSYFESNRLSVMARHDTFKESMEEIALCNSREELYHTMNPGFRDRYHKMNLTNLDTGRQPTVEFRQHHATKDLVEITSWACFCILFVVNASKLPLLLGGSITEQATFDGLFDTIIKCPTLKEHYSQKKLKFGSRMDK